MSNLKISLILLVTLIIIITIIVFVKYMDNQYEIENNIEGFDDNDERIIYKYDENVYDKFYCQIYDFLMYNKKQVDYEIGTIVKRTKMEPSNVILVLNSNTGYYNAALSKHNIPSLGNDQCKDMIKTSKQLYPKLNFKLAVNFKPNFYSHILCLNYGIYFLEDKKRFIQNCKNWVKKNGYLVIHIVDESNFTNLISPSHLLDKNKNRIKDTSKPKQSHIRFNQFNYYSRAIKDEENDEMITYQEKFIFKNNKTRINEQTLYMTNYHNIISIIKDTGFKIEYKINLDKFRKGEYIYIFKVDKNK